MAIRFDVKRCERELCIAIPSKSVKNARLATDCEPDTNARVVAMRRASWGKLLNTFCRQKLRSTSWLVARLAGRRPDRTPCINHLINRGLYCRLAQYPS